jgi:hypothetical protein
MFLWNDKTSVKFCTSAEVLTVDRIAETMKLFLLIAKEREIL